MRRSAEIWNLTFRAANILIGTLLGLALVYVIQKEVNLSVLLGALTGALLLFGINLIRVRMPNGIVSRPDESLRKKSVKFLLVSSHILLGILFLALSIINFLGVESVPTSLLWCGMIGYLLIAGIGVFFMNRK